MKVTPDDPRLSAYLLGELTAEEAAMIERAAAADPAIRLCLDEMERTTSFLEDVFDQGDRHSLLPAHREAIRRAGRDADSVGKVVELASARRSLRPWLGGLGAAAVVAFAAVLMSRVDPGGPSTGTDGGLVVTEEIALLPMPGPAVGEAATGVGGQGVPAAEQAKNLDERPGEFLGAVARQLDRGPLPDAGRLPPTRDLSIFETSGETRLPVVVGNSSLKWVSGWIREKGSLPPRDAVRVEELVNSTSLRRLKVVADLGLAMESIKCPWNPGSMLVGIQLRAGQMDVQDLEMTYQFDGERRLLGSFAVRGDADLPRILPAGRSTLVMLEMKPSGAGLGDLRIKQGDFTREQSVPTLAGEASVEMRHAGLMAGFGLWLRKEGVSSDDIRRMLDSLVDDQDPVRADVRRVIDKALELAEAKR